MSYNFDSEKYDDAISYQSDLGKKIIQGLFLNGDEKILDLACGDGELTKKISLMLNTGKIIGIDGSEKLIKEAKKNSNDKLEFIHGSIVDLDYNNEFDIVFSNGALHWLNNHTLLLKNAYKALKKDGVIRFNFFGKGTMTNTINVLEKTIKSDRFSKYFTDFKWPWFMPSLDEYEVLCQDTQFKDIDIWTENADRYFKEPEEMIMWLEKPYIIPFISHLEIKNKKLVEEFKDIVFSQVVEKTIQADGTCFETFNRINIYGKK